MLLGLNDNLVLGLDLFRFGRHSLCHGIISVFELGLHQLLTLHWLFLVALSFPVLILLSCLRLGFFEFLLDFGEFIQRVIDVLLVNDGANDVEINEV